MMKSLTLVALYFLTQSSYSIAQEGSGRGGGDPKFILNTLRLTFPDKSDCDLAAMLKRDQLLQGLFSEAVLSDATITDLENLCANKKSSQKKR